MPVYPTTEQPQLFPPEMPPETGPVPITSAPPPPGGYEGFTEAQADEPETRRRVDTPTEAGVTTLNDEDRAAFSSLLSCGKRSKTIEVMGHEVGIESLNVDDDLRIGMYCLAGETPVITSTGTYMIKELAGTTSRVLTTGGKWVSAPFKSYGQQSLMRVVLQRNGRQQEIFATPEHRWFTQRKATPRKGMNSSWKGWEKEETITSTLKPGQILVSVYARNFCGNIKPSSFGIAHGFVFGDGSKYARNRGSYVDLHGEKDLNMLQFFPNPSTGVYEQNDGPTLRVMGLPNYFKDVPSLEESSSYLYGWLAGYFAADGSVSPKGEATLCSVSLRNIEHVEAVCQLLGIKTSRQGGHLYKTGFGNSAIHYYLYLENNSLTESFFCIPKHREKWRAHAERKFRETWRVISVESTDRLEEVYCAEIPGTEAFAIGGNILTGNCKEYRESDAYPRAVQVGTCAAGIRTVDRRALYSSLSPDESPESVFRAKVTKLEKFYPVVITEIYREILNLDAEFADLAIKLGKLKG